MLKIWRRVIYVYEELVCCDSTKAVIVNSSSEQNVWTHNMKQCQASAGPNVIPGAFDDVMLRYGRVVRVLLAMSCMTKTGSSIWSRPCMHDYSCGLSLCFPPIVGPCHWGCDDWRWCFVRPVLPKIQPMSCDDDFMPIFPTLWELLLRTVFQDWIVDDGNYYPSCGKTLMAIMTHFGELLVKVCLKTILTVCNVVNSAGQRVLNLREEKSNRML